MWFLSLIIKNFNLSTSRSTNLVNLNNNLKIQSEVLI